MDEDLPYDEDNFLQDMRRIYPQAGNILYRHGLNIAKLRELPRGPIINERKFVKTRYEYQNGRGEDFTWYTWEELFDVRSFGITSMLHVVNFCRSKKIELPWFKDWDRYSKDHPGLKGRTRVRKVRRARQ